MIKKDNNTFEFTRKELMYLISLGDRAIQFSIDDEIDPNDPDSKTFSEMLFGDLDRRAILNLLEEIRDDLYEKVPTYEYGWL